METYRLEKIISDFQDTVMKLSEKIGSAGALWRDPKYSELAASVSAVAGQAREVLDSGESVYHSINDFEQISAEKY